MHSALSTQRLQLRDHHFQGPLLPRLNYLLGLSPSHPQEDPLCSTLVFSALTQMLTPSSCLSAQFPITALREIKILQLLKHENVVNLIEICRTKGQ